MRGTAKLLENGKVSKEQGFRAHARRALAVSSPPPEKASKRSDCKGILYYKILGYIPRDWGLLPNKRAVGIGMLRAISLLLGMQIYLY